MIVNQKETDAKREGYIAALRAVYGSDANVASAEERYPYQQERIITVTMQDGTQKLFRVTAEDTDDFFAGRLVVARNTKRLDWGAAYVSVADFTPAGLRQIADLLETPLEDYVEPEKAVAISDQESA